jgi:hypothetical protein
VAEFFKGWRRKTGLVTLMMALVLTAAWMRSDTVYAATAFAVGSRQFAIQSGRGYVKLSRWKPRDDERLLWGWQCFSPNEDQERGLIVRQLAIDGHKDSASWNIPYWMLTILPALLSAWLILGKTRKAKPAPASHDEHQISLR